MLELNVLAAWTAILCGMLGGAVQGLFFHRSGWAGGYGSWPRRLMRLGHISFFGLAFVNLAFAGTVALRTPAGAAFSVETELSPLLRVASGLLIAGAVLMPLVCYLSAWRKPFRHAFFLPVGCLLAGVAAVLAWCFPGA